MAGRLSVLVPLLVLLSAGHVSAKGKCNKWIAAPSLGRMYMFVNDSRKRGEAGRRCLGDQTSWFATLDTQKKKDILISIWPDCFPDRGSLSFWVNNDQATYEDCTDDEYSSGADCPTAYSICEKEAKCDTKSRKCYYMSQDKSKKEDVVCRQTSKLAQFYTQDEYSNFKALNFIPVMDPQAGHFARSKNHIDMLRRTNKSFWIGLSRDADNGGWKWGSDIPLTYHLVENQQNSGRRCAVIKFSGGELSVQSKDCNVKHRAICEAYGVDRRTMVVELGEKNELTCPFGTVIFPIKATIGNKSQRIHFNMTLETGLNRCTGKSNCIINCSPYQATIVYECRQGEAPANDSDATATQMQCSTTTETTTESTTAKVTQEETTSETLSTKDTETTNKQEGTTAMSTKQPMITISTKEVEIVTSEAKDATRLITATHAAVSTSVKTSITFSTGLTTITAEMATSPAERRSCPVRSKPRRGTKYSISADSLMMTISCDVDFHFDDGTTARTLVCRENGAWHVMPIPQCKAVRCPYTFAPNNSHVTGYSNDVGARVRFTCVGGMRMADGSHAKTIYCTSTGEWTDTVTDCKDKDMQCPPVPLQLDADVNTTDTRVGISVSVRCKSGFTFGSNVNKSVVTITCRADMRWHPDLQPCRAMMCQEPGMVANATLTSDSKEIGSLAQYDCNPGHRFNDGSTTKRIQCEKSGNWSATVDDCQYDPCYPLPDVGNATSGAAMVTIPGTSGTVSVSHTCDPGHRFADGQRLMMSHCESGKWELNHRRCDKVGCLEPPAIPHAGVEISDLFFGAMAKYSCETGFAFHNNKTEASVTCSESGYGGRLEWLPVLSECQMVRCPPPRDVFGASRDSDDVIFNSTVIYKCQEGFKFKGIGQYDSTTCNETGDWDHQISDCVGVQCNALPHWKEMVFNTTERDVNTTVNYRCAPSEVFADKSVMKTSACSSAGEWTPVIQSCQALKVAIKEVTVEAKQSAYIGSAILAVIVAIATCIIMLDVPHLLHDLRLMKANLRHFKDAVIEAYEKRSNRRCGPTECFEM